MPPVRLSDQRLQELHELMRFQVRGSVSNNARRAKQGKPPRAVMVYIDGQEVLYILDELRQRRGTRKGQTGPSQRTQILMDMAVGDVVFFEPITQGALTTLRRTARKRMENPDARWHGETQNDGRVKITRMKDGSDHIFGLPRNPDIELMALMKVDDVLILKNVKGKMYNGMKVQARRIMENSEANWKCENLANGLVRARRIR